MEFLSHAAGRSPLSRTLTVSPRADIVCYDIESQDWPAPPMVMACLSDFHAMRPWSPLRSTRRYVETVNRIGPDIVFLLGDYTAAHLTPGVSEKPDLMAETLTGLEAPHGVHAILGNHDWIDDPLARDTDQATSAISQALASAGLLPLINTSRRITHHGEDVWLVGLDSQWAPRAGRKRRGGRHDPDQAFRDVPEGAAAILLAHEPDYFVFGDHRPLLQLSGHTHGGQANFFGWRPFTPSDYHDRYAYGHVREGGRHLVVSGGLGYTHVPMRIAQPPEITLVRLSNPGL